MRIRSAVRAGCTFAVIGLAACMDDQPTTSSPVDVQGLAASKKATSDEVVRVNPALARIDARLAARGSNLRFARAEVIYAGEGVRGSIADGDHREQSDPLERLRVGLRRSAARRTERRHLCGGPTAPDLLDGPCIPGAGRGDRRGVPAVLAGGAGRLPRGGHAGVARQEVQRCTFRSGSGSGGNRSGPARRPLPGTPDSERELPAAVRHRAGRLAARGVLRCHHSRWVGRDPRCRVLLQLRRRPRELRPTSTETASSTLAWSRSISTPTFIWTNRGAPGFIDFFSVLTHEIGHSLGLGHFGKVFITKKDAADGLQIADLKYAPKALMNAVYVQGRDEIRGSDNGSFCQIWASKN